MFVLVEYKIIGLVQFLLDAISTFFVIFLKKTLSFGCIKCLLLLIDFVVCLVL